MKKVIRWLIVVLICLALGYFIYQKIQKDPIEVTVETITLGTVEKVVANTRAGTVNACRRARLSPSIGGQIARLPIEEGDIVKKGDLLLEIWNDDLRARLEVAEEEVTVAQAEAVAACRSAEEAERQADRAEKLFRSNAGSEDARDSAVTRAESLRAKCEAAGAAVQRSTAQVKLARANLDRSRLVAPFGGVIAKIEGELNEYVTPSPVGVQTPPAVDLIENDCFYVSAPIDEVDAAKVQVGMVARITLDAYRDRVFEGKVRRIAPYVLDLEKQARTVDIEVAFVDGLDHTELLAGYSADVEIVIDIHKNTLKVPTEAVIEESSVYLFSEGIIEKATFSPGLRNWAVTEALEGLKEGQQVIINVDTPGLEGGVQAVVGEPQP